MTETGDKVQAWRLPWLWWTGVAFAWAVVAFVVPWWLRRAAQPTGPDAVVRAMLFAATATLLLLVVVGLTAAAGSHHEPRAAGWGDRVAAGLLVLFVSIQLLLGQLQSLRREWLWAHVLTGVAAVLPVAIRVGVRSWLLGGRGRRLGVGLVLVLVTQVTLGVSALLIPPRLGWHVLVRQLHAMLGPLFLALAMFVLVRWSADSAVTDEGPV